MPHFTPIYPSHAIERCSINIGFTPDIPPKLYLPTIDNVKSSLVERGFKKNEDMVSFRFENGKIHPADNKVDGGPVLFARQGASPVELEITPNSIRWTASRYINWSSFISEFDDVYDSLFSEFAKVSSIHSIRLEYFDRFFWAGDWKTFDSAKLIVNDCPYYSNASRNALKETHTHTGWFEYPDDNLGKRLLNNVNIDINSVVQGTQSLTPSIGIYTSAERQLAGNSLLSNQQQIDDELNKLHLGLLNTLRGIICEDMQKKIGLEKGN